MNKLKKVSLTALGTALVSSASFAADMSVTGSAGLTFSGGDNANTGNGWSMSDTITIAGSADLDNGWTVSTSMSLDNDSTAADIDAASTTINMGDMGSLTFAGEDGSGPIAAWDDVMPTANEEAHHGVAGTPTGPTQGASGNQNFTYTNSSAIDGVALTVFYQPSGNAANIKSSVEYGIQYTGIDGLDVGFAMGENEDGVAPTNINTAIAAGGTYDNTVMYAKYTMDAFTFGYQTNSVDGSTANSDYDFTGIGLSYAVTEDISVSYNTTEVDYEEAGRGDQEATGLSASWTNGSVTVSASTHDVKNVQGTNTVDNKAYEINFGFAF